MNNDLNENLNFEVANSYKRWNWWPLFPLYPYGTKKTIIKEIVPKMIWGIEQLQGLYYVAVPIRLTVVKVPNGLMLINPLPPTKELISYIKLLEDEHGPVLKVVLPTSSGLEHKIAMPAMARYFKNAELWLCPGQWSFPLNLPLRFLGLPSDRTKFLLKDGFPYPEIFDWISLGPIDIGLGRFQEIACFHKISKSLIITDALVGINSKPPELFEYDPTPLLFHARDKGSEKLIDTLDQRKKGWLRLVLFASFLKPHLLSIPPIEEIIGNSLRPGLRNLRSHLGIYPFCWEEGWEKSALQIIGKQKPLLQVAPVIRRLVFPRAKNEFLNWLDKLSCLKGMERVISAHFCSSVEFNNYECMKLIRSIKSTDWDNSEGNYNFLSVLDNNLLNLKVVPKDPLKKFKD